MVKSTYSDQNILLDILVEISVLEFRDERMSTRPGKGVLKHFKNQSTFWQKICLYFLQNSKCNDVTTINYTLSDSSIQWRLMVQCLI